MIASGNATTDALRGADGEVLLEGRRALDGGLVDLSVRVDVGGAAIARHGALVRRASGEVVGTVRFDDVVLDQRVGSPPVDGEVSIP